MYMALISDCCDMYIFYVGYNGKIVISTTKHGNEKNVRQPSTNEKAGHGIQCHSHQYFSYIVAVSFIAGGNQNIPRKPPTCSNK